MLIVDEFYLPLFKLLKKFHVTLKYLDVIENTVLI